MLMPMRFDAEVAFGVTRVWLFKTWAGGFLFALFRHLQVLVEYIANALQPKQLVIQGVPLVVR